MTTSVRSALVELAAAYHASSRNAEALEALDRALDEPDTTPPTWRLHELRGDVLSGRQQEAAVGEYLQAVLARPTEETSGVAERALAMMSSCAMPLAVEPAVVKALVDKALDHPPPPPATLRLIASLMGSVEGPVPMPVMDRLGNLTEDADVVAQIAEEQIRQGRPQDALEALARTSSPLVSSVRTRAHLELGQYQQALDDLPDASPSVLRALALYGLGDFDRAQRELSALPPTHDKMLAEAIVALALTSTQFHSSRAGSVEDAIRAAVAAGRHDSTSKDAILIRAQARLEGSMDLDESRKLLASALKSQPDAEQSLWWRLQRSAREDDFLTYARAEIAHAQGDLARAAEYAALTGTSVTSDLQDGALAEFRALWSEQQGGTTEAGEHWLQAARSYAAAEESTRSLAASRRALQIAPDIDTTLEHVERLWRSSYDPDLGPQLVAEAHDLLTGLEPSVDQGHLMRFVSLSGRITARLVEDYPDGEAAWRAMPWQLAAAVASAQEPYEMAYAAWAANDAGLTAAADRLASMAWERRPDDGWLRETRMVALVNWNGRLTPEADRVLTREGSPDRDDWEAPLKAGGQFIGGDHRNLPRLVEQLDSDEAWARELRARAALLCDHPDAPDLLDDVVEASAEEPSSQWMFLLLQGSVKEAAARLEEAIASGTLHSREARISQGQLELVQSAGTRGEEEIGEVVDTVTVPFLLRSILFVDLPLIGKVFPSAALDAAVGRLRRRISKRIDEVEGLGPQWLAHADPSPKVEASVIDTVLDVLRLVAATTSGDLEGEHEARARLQGTDLPDPVRRLLDASP